MKLNYDYHNFYETISSAVFKEEIFEEKNCYIVVYQTNLK